MISSIFYFADTEQEYLDNFNRRQVKPYTIVFCKDTHSVWKNGVRYGGSTSAETQSQISEIIDRDVAPLLQQLESAIQQANDATDRAEGHLSDISTQMDAAINDLQNAIDSEKTRLDGKVAEINQNIEDRVQDILADYQDLVDNFEDNVANKIESLLDDAEWVQQNIPQAEVTWDSSWDQNVDNRMQVAGYWDVDPETGEKTTKWSKLEQSVDHIGTEISELSESVDGSIEAVNTRIDQTANSITTTANSISNIDGRLQTAESTITQVPDAIVAAVQTSSQTLNGNIATAKSEVIQKASEIVSQVTGVTVANDGTVDTTNTSLQQQITNEGNARAQLATQWANADADTKEVLEWMYSGLTTEAGDDKTFTELVAAAQDGDHSAISNITNLVEKVENEDGTFSYRAKSALTSAVDNALSGFISNTSSDYASAQFFAELNSDIAGLKASTGDASALEGIVTKDSFAAELKAVASKDWAETTMATKLRVPKKNDNGDVVYDEQGNVVYEDVADVLGAMRTTIDVLDGGPQVTNSIDAKVNDAISTFEQKVNDGEACTTLVNRVNSDNEVLSGLVSKVTGDTSSNTMLSKVNGMTAGVVTTANLETAVAGLIARQDAIITLTVSGPGTPPSGTLNMGPHGVASLPSSITNQIAGPGTVLTLSATDFNTAFQSQGIYYTTISTQSGDQQANIPIKYVAGETGVQSGPYYAISDGQYLFTTNGLIIKIGIQDLSGAVFSKVDNKLNTATAGLASKSYVTGREAAILTEVDDRIGTATVGLVAQSDIDGVKAEIIASVNQDMSEITLSADQINITNSFINAIGSRLDIDSVVADAISATTISANTIDANSTWKDEDENEYTSHTIVDGEGLRIYSGAAGNKYDPEDEQDEYYGNANNMIHNSGSGWLANGHITWNAEGDTYIGPGDPDSGDDGIYVYEDDGVTKIKLQGEITAKDLSWDNIRGNERLGDGYRVGNKKKYESGERDVAGALYDYGFYVALQTFYHQPANSSGVYGDYILGNGPSQDETYGAYTTVDWGAIGIGKNGISAIPNPRNVNGQPTNYNERVDGSRNTPPVTLQVKGKDGYVYTGFTGCSGDMYYINGIAIGPASEIGSYGTML